MVRLHLMLQDRAAADRWADVLCDVAQGSAEQGQWLVALGAEFHRAREEDAAQRFYVEAVTTPFRSHANIGLAGLAQGAGDRTRAREHLLAALNLENIRLMRDETPGNLFHAVIGRLVALEERRVQCRAWVGAIPGTATSPLVGTSLLVFAPDLAGAQAHLGEITNAMQKSGTSFDLSTVRWSEASTEHQPLRPVAPGVQFVMAD